MAALQGCYLILSNLEAFDVLHNFIDIYDLSYLILKTQTQHCSVSHPRGGGVGACDAFMKQIPVLFAMGQLLHHVIAGGGQASCTSAVLGGSKAAQQQAFFSSE